MELHPYHKGVPFYLGDLYQISIGRNTTSKKTHIFQVLTVGVVQLETVPVPLIDQGLLIGSMRNPALQQATGVGAQPHSATFFGDGTLLWHYIYHRKGCVGVYLR